MNETKFFGPGHLHKDISYHKKKSNKYAQKIVFEIREIEIIREMSYKLDLSPSSFIRRIVREAIKEYLLKKKQEAKNGVLE